MVTLRTTTVWVAKDGAEFTSQEEAVGYENGLEVTKAEQLEKYHRTFSYKTLMEKHTLQEEGVWQVHGEDDNAGLSGPHYEPLLGTYEGKLEDVIKVAVMLPGFWAWGAGGRIKKSEPTKIIKV